MSKIPSPEEEALIRWSDSAYSEEDLSVKEMVTMPIIDRRALLALVDSLRESRMCPSCNDMVEGTDWMCGNCAAGRRRDVALSALIELRDAVLAFRKEDERASMPGVSMDAFAKASDRLHIATAAAAAFEVSK